MSEENRENMQVDYHADEEEEDPEIAALQAEIKNTNDSLLQTRNLQKALEEGSKATPSTSTSAEAGSSTAGAAAGADGAAAAEGSEEKEETDGRSVFVGNVDYSATPEELQQHFQACGAINRITILCDKFTGHPKGFAYVEFSEQSSVTNAMVLNESLFKGRQIQVTAKRTNKPAWQLGGRGRGRGRGSYRGGYQPRGGYSPYRGRGRGRGRGSFQ